MKKTMLSIFKILMLTVLAGAMLLSAVSCVSVRSEWDSVQQALKENEQKLAELESRLEALETQTNLHQYDFYITLGTLPTLYATLNAYQTQNPNTYMWFYRGNTISYDYSAEHIHYFDTQSKTNAYSTIDYDVIRTQITDIMKKDPLAKFHLYCDDLRASFILSLFVYVGVDFEDLQVTFLSDGTGTYNLFYNQTDETYAEYAEEWNTLLNTFVEARNNPEFTSEHAVNDQATTLQHLAFYLTTFPNVEIWAQHPDYLISNGETVMAEKSKMNIVKKDPKEMYLSLNAGVRHDYQMAVLANALVDSDTLNTLDDAVSYFDEMLDNRDKEVVLILGTNRDTLAQNQFYMDETIAFYTPTVVPNDPTKVTYKGQEYTITAGDSKVIVDGAELTIGELGVYLFFKGHPAYPAQEDLQAYFDAHNIVVLPHRTPVETLFWLYDVKVGGYQSTSFLSASIGQTEFFFEEPTINTLIQMRDAGFFENAVIFTMPLDE